MGIYALVFAICLVLLVCKLISSSALKFGFTSWRVFLRDERARLVETDKQAKLDRDGLAYPLRGTHITISDQPVGMLEMDQGFPDNAAFVAVVGSNPER
jgi:hypothetical protein